MNYEKAENELKYDKTNTRAHAPCVAHLRMTIY